jgi:protein gp37
MSKGSAIQWTKDTWPIVTGCEFASEGCINCYALKDSWRLAHNPNPKVSEPYKDTVVKAANGKLQWSGLVKCHPDRLGWILNWGSWQDSHLVFVCNMADLFHKDVPFEFVDRAIAYMILGAWNKYQILTKRPQRMMEYFTAPHRTEKIQNALILAWDTVMDNPSRKVKAMLEGSLHSDWLLKQTKNLKLPLEHIWLGHSVCTQEDAQDIDYLLKTPAAVHFLSCEPLLEEVNLSEWLGEFIGKGMCDGCGEQGKLYAINVAPVAGAAICTECAPRPDWVIVGGESGAKARPTYLEHLRSLVKQANFAEVPVFVKQLGAKPVAHWDEENQVLTMHKISDRKGGILEELPAELQIRQFPEAL